MDETRQFLFETNFQRTKLTVNLNIIIYLQEITNYKNVENWANDHLIEFHLTEIDIFHLIEIVVIS